MDSKGKNDHHDELPMVFSSIDQSQTAHIGRWQSTNDVLARCYAKLPNSSTLVRMANCESMEDYTPHRLLIDPPEELLKTILPQFDDVLQAATKVHLLLYALINDMN